MKKVYYSSKPAKIKWIGQRIVGCQSKNHTICKGELWECKRCHRRICWEEGSADDLVDLCDDCWYDIKVLEHEFSFGIISTWKVHYETT